MRNLSLRVAAALIAATSALCLSPLGATTYMPMADATLADQSPVAISGRVLQSAPSTIGRMPATEYLVAVDEVLKGEPVAGTIAVRVPGGVGANGLGLRLSGAPSFGPGEEVVLFLARAADGDYRLQQFLLGAFHVRTENGRRLATRDLGDAVAVTNKGLAPGTERLERDHDLFAAWVRDRAAGERRDADYWLPAAAGPLRPATAKFTQLTFDDDGLPIRWFAFDRGETIDWRVHSGGQPGLGLASSIDAFNAALDVWVADAPTKIFYRFVGTTDAAGGHTESDDVNAILFGDPDGNAEGTFSCEGGGVIAIGGPYFYLATRVFRGERYHEAAEGDIVTNDGTECFFSGNRRVAEEVFSHELGHTLGLGHSADREALMAARVHNDNRGAALHPDDLAGIRKLYSPLPPATTVPKAPKNLKARAISSTEIALTWKDLANNEDLFSVQMKVGTGPWREIGRLPGDTVSAVVDGLAKNKQHSFRVRALNTKGFSAFSNVAKATTPRN